MSAEETNADAPLVRLQPGGKASIIDYNVPESVSYGGQHYVALDLDPKWFTDAASSGETYLDWIRRQLRVDLHDEASLTGRVRADLADRLRDSLADGAGPVVGPSHERFDRDLAMLVDAANRRRTTERQPFRPFSGTSRTDTVASRTDSGETADETGATASTEPDPLPFTMHRAVAPEVFEAVRPEAVADAVLDRRLPLLRYNLAGTLVPTYIRAPPRTKPQLMLVERYRLSTFLGDYGAGRTLKTFSLLPGEETTIRFQSYRRSKETREHASSILDSFTETAAREFEHHVENEQWDREAYNTSVGYSSTKSSSGGGSAGLNLGFFKIGGSGKASSSKHFELGIEVAREELTKNVTSAVSKHAHESSTRRDVEINTNYEESTETGESQSTVRRVENVNLGRTLNFVFRQMNQEFHTLLHLVDVRVAFTNGAVRTNAAGTSVTGLEYREVPLSQLDDLLNEFIDADHHDEVRALIETELSGVTNHAGEQRSMVERATLHTLDGEPSRDYLRVPQLTDTYDGREVQGVVVTADTNVLRTEGVVVEALLGQSDALDRYSARLQEETVERRDEENAALAAETEKTRLGIQVVRDADAERAAVYRDVFGAAGSSTPASRNRTDTDEPAPTP